MKDFQLGEAVSKFDKNVKLLWRDKYDFNKFIGETDDYIIACGGDGTLLKAVHKYANLNKSFYGRAAGTVNFLMNKEKYPMGDYKIKSFSRIKVSVNYKKWVRNMASIDDKLINVTKEFQAFNDICIGGSDGMNAWINFNIQEKDEIFGEVQGGGLIISTPQGSTGINKTNRGVVLPLSSDQWSITGDKTTRQIAYVVKPHKMEIIPSSRKDIIVWIDGENEVIEKVTSITVEKGDNINVIFNDYGSFKKKRRI